MQTPYSYLVLYDFSHCAQQALRVAHQWSKWTGAELHLLYNLEGSLAPAMADQGLRQQLFAISKAEAFNKAQRSFEEVTGETIHPLNVHIAVKSLATTINRLVEELNTQLLFAGLKGHGVLKRLFIGSTVLNLLEHARIPVVAIPKQIGRFNKIALHICVSYHFTFNSMALQQFLQLMGSKIDFINFISVLTRDDDRQQAANHLAQLDSLFSKRAVVQTHLFEGNEPLAQVKAYMNAQEDGMLMLQKGSRAFSDHIFREFFINELVYDASLPLIILPS